MALAATLVLVLLVFAVRFSFELVDASSWVEHTTEVMSQIRATRALLGAPGMAGAGSATAAMLEQFSQVAELTRDNPRQQSAAAEFGKLFENRGGPSDEAALSRSERIETAATLLSRMQTEEFRLLRERTQRQTSAIHHALLAVIALCVVLLAIGLGTAVGEVRELRRRERAERTLKEEKSELTRYSRALALIHTASELIQSSSDEEQMNAAVASVMPELIPGSSGYFALLSPSKDMVEICGQWGQTGEVKPFKPAACTALQLGRAIEPSQSAMSLACKQCSCTGNDFLCMPIRSASGHLGVLHVDSAAPVAKTGADTVALFASHVALGLTNLRMREALRGQSVRDPLTGMFNRRYFDETLRRELLGAERSGRVLSLLMLDLDRFKSVNDTFGHAVGDEVLRAFARLMHSTFRQNDVLCRYGGEEFAIVLDDTDLAEAFSKAETFRNVIAAAEIHVSRFMGQITTSIGVASSDEFASPEELVSAADAALYQAKRTSRNATFACSKKHSALPSIPPPAPQAMAVPSLPAAAWTQN